MTALDLAAVLERLGYDEGELVQICWQGAGGPFTARVVDLTAAVGYEVPQDRDVWFGVNPCSAVEKGRPGAADVTRLAALFADLDVKPGGCASLEVAYQIVDDLSAALGQRPVAVIMSGHGLQPLWAVEDAHIDDTLAEGDEVDGITRNDARAVLRRWGRLARHLAELRSARVDSVFDLPRILRCPGSVNHKAEPVTVVTTADTGGPVAIERLIEVLDEFAIADLDTDYADPGTLVSAPADWTYATTPCAYGLAMVKRWATDTPEARHPWLVAQATRIACLHRAGCLTAAAHLDAVTVLVERLHALVGGDRGEGPGESSDALVWGQQRAAAMSETQLHDELGNHLHADEAGDRLLAKVRMRPLAAVPDLPRDESPSKVNGPPSGSLFDAAPLAQIVAPGFASATQTDRGNAGLFVDRHHARLRYQPSRAAWLAWHGHRWALCDDDAEALSAVVETIEAVVPANDTARKHKLSSLSGRALTTALRLGRASPLMVVSPDQLDADPYALNTPSGIVNLRTGQLRPPSIDALCTYSTAVAYDPAAVAPKFEAFLADTFGDDAELVGYLQRLAGYSATGITTAHVLPFLHGGGSNGKSVFLDVIGGVLGDYATTAPPNFLLASAREDESAVARLKGARLVVASEVSQSARFDEAKVKLLTGGDRLTARHLYGRHFTFTPTHTLWLMGNHQPSVQAGGESFWRRLRLIPFTRTVPTAERVEGLSASILEAESPGVLAWIVRGAIAALAGGLGEPESVLAATSEYAAEEDALARFVGEALVLGGGHLVKINTKAVRGAYESWCRDEGEQPITPQGLARELRTRFGVQSTRANGQRFYVGLSLATTRSDSDLSDLSVTSPQSIGHWLKRALDQPLWDED